MRMLTSCLACAALVLPALADNWPNFRGPHSAGVSPDKDLPTTWSDTQNLVWKRALPGPGGSSPIVWGDKVFVTCYTGYGDPNGAGRLEELSRHLICVDRKGGRILWDRESKAEQPEKAYTGPYITKHGYASSTPATDGQRVYVFYGKTGVLAYDLAGNELWRAHVGSKTHDWGSGTSPVLSKDLVMVNAFVESDSLGALDKTSGKKRWRKPGMRMSWSTPVLVDVDHRQELVVSIMGKLLALDPETGEELWHCQGIADYICPSVIAHQGVVYAIGGRPDTVTALAVRAGGRGDVSSTHVLWRIHRGSNVTSQVYHDGYLYWTNESRGILYCVHASDGKIVYEQRLQPTPDLIYASPTVADGKIYIVSRTAGTYVVAAEPTYKLLAHNTLDDDTSIFNASPAVSDSQLFLRSNKYLYCIGQR
jgi:outer membrane protein assembly factor BamB